MNKSAIWTEEQLRQAIKDNISIRAVLKALGLSPVGGNYSTIKNKIKRLNIDTTHFKGMGYLKGQKCTWAKPRPLEEVLVKDSPYQSFKLKKRLIAAGLLPEECRNCGGSEWMGSKIPLELEHKNGDKFDNRMENLELLCPNCHSLTDTYRGKNKRRYYK